MPGRPTWCAGWQRSRARPGALTSVALRTPGGGRSDVEAALDAGDVVRSWPMRGTLHLVVAEDEPDEGGEPHVLAAGQGVAQDLGVGARLEKRGDRLAAGELGVADDPRPVVVADEEVAEPEEVAVEDARLMDDLDRRVGHERQRLGHAGLQSGAGTLRGARAADAPGVLTVQPLQDPLLVGDAQLGCPPGHLVDGCLHPFAPAESDVERGEHRVLARAGRPQVARREDHGAEGSAGGIGEEHGVRLRGGADTHTQLGNHIRHCQCSYGMTCAV